MVAMVLAAAESREKCKRQSSFTDRLLGTSASLLGILDDHVFK